MDRPTTPASLAARRGRVAPPLNPVKTSFDDSLLQVSTPLPPSSSSPGRPPKIASSPRPAPQPASRPPLRQTRSYNNGKPSLFDLFSRPKVESPYDPSSTLPRKSLSVHRPKPSSKPSKENDLPSLPDHLKPVLQEPKNHHNTPVLSNDKPTFAPTPAPGVPRTDRLDFSSALKDLEPPRHATAPEILGAWMPPPLFQAYPQAITHAALEDPGLYRGGASRRKRSGRLINATPSRPSTGYGKSQRSQAHRRPSEVADAMPDDMPDDGTPRKIYILVSAGYVLEYAGTGARDRLPERTVKLGRHSAAFASDAIPGKHWVLQLVQSTLDDPAADQQLTSKKSLVSRMFGSTPKKQPVRRMLLICDSPATMNTWMLAVRQEISRFSGSAARPPTAVPKKRSEDEEIRLLPTLPKSGPMDVSVEPSSPPKVVPPLPSPPTLPNSPTTLAGSERLSRAETVVVSGSNISSSRSSRAVLPKTLDLQKTTAIKLLSEETKEVPELELEDDRASKTSNRRDRSRKPNSQDSSSQASRYSSDDLTPLEDPETASPDTASSLASPLSHFYTPMTTPVTFSFPQDSPRTANKRLSTYAEVEAVATKTEAPINEASATVTSLRSNTHSLRQSQSAPRMASATPTAMETIRESSQYFSRRNPEALAEEPASPPRSPLGNAFAQAAERRAGRSNSQTSQQSSGPPTGRSSIQPVPARSSPRGTPHSSQPGSKRTSVIHSTGPLPLRTSQTYESLGMKPLRDSAGAEALLSADFRNITTKGESDSRESALQQLSAGSSPGFGHGDGHVDGASASLQSSASGRLRRPNSLRVKTDVTPFLSSARTTQSPPQQATPQSADSTTTAISTARSPPNSGRSSTLVPVVRPPSVRPHAVGGGQRQLRMGSGQGPPSAPPTVPLPRPPMHVSMSRMA